MDFFRETTFWPCALKFLHTLQIGQVLLAHTPIGMGFPPPKKNNRKHLKFVLKFSDLRSITSGLMAVSSRDFFQSMSREAGVITWAQFFTRSAPKNLCPPKNRPKFFAIFDNFRLWSRISPERINKLKIGIALENLQPLLRWTKRVGVLWSTNEKVIELNKFTP